MIMKKLLLLSLLATFAFVSCDSDDDSTPVIDTETVYTGNIQVLATGATEPFTLQDVTCEVVLDDTKKSLDLFVNDVKFAEAMPMAIDITLPGIPCTVVDETVAFSFEGNLIPLVGTVETPAFAFSKIDGVISDSHLNFNSTCTRGIIAFDGKLSE